MRRLTRIAMLLLISVALGALLATVAAAAPLSDDGGAEWQLAQPDAPEPPAGVEAPGHLIGLGHVGDIEFESPDRGALITSGNGGAVLPGVWLYDGVRWRELATVCGATDGRIAWAGPDEFWTVSDGRPGQAAFEGREPPLADDTLCHFGVGASGRFEVLGSYATLAFQSTSYQAMHGAACISPTDCWFGGDQLPSPGLGSFQLHWNGSNVTAEPFTLEGHAVEEMRTFENAIYQSLQLLKNDPRITRQPTIPPLRRITTDSEKRFEPLEPPLLGATQSPLWVQALALGSDGEALWAAGGISELGEKEESPYGVAVLRYSKTQFNGSGYTEAPTPSWQRVIDQEARGKEAPFGEEIDATSIAAEPGTKSAWLGLDTLGDIERPSTTAPGRVARVSGDGTVSDSQTLPETGGPLGPKGAVEHIACPAEHDCWLVTAQGWLFHLAVPGEAAEGPPDAAFAEVPGELPIDQRPLDEGVPPQVPDALPEDDSGEGGPPTGPSVSELLKSVPSPFATITLPLLSNVHSKLIHGTTLQLSFHLAVKARIRLIAKRKKTVVASTRTQTLAHGNHKLLLKLDPHRWPTSLHFQTHALAPLPTTNTRESNTGTIGTSELLPSAATAEDWSRLP